MKLISKKGVISVIVPIYNTANYLNKCIQSLVNQTYQHLEIILVDDGSNDGSADICDRYASEYDYITVIHTKNGGSSAARNIGIKHGSGDYISFIDSDDYISEDFYESMMNYMLPDVDIVSCGFNTMYPDGKIMKLCTPDRVLYFSGDEVVKELLKTVYVNFSMCNKIFRKKCIENACFPVGKNHEDIPVMYNAAKNCSKIVCINDAKYFYSVRAGSNSRKPFNIGNLYLAVSTRDIYMDVKKYYPQYKRLALNRHFEYVLYLIDLIYDGKTSKYEKVRKEFEREIRHYTVHIIRNNEINLNLKARLLQAGWECKSSIIRQWHENSDKYLISTKLFSQWFEKKQNGKQLEDYFQRNHIYTIAIYGMSYLGQRLYDELKDSNVTVKYVIDKNAKDTASYVRVITPKDEMEPVDAIVVTATYYYNEIRKQLKVNGIKYKIISLEDIIQSM